MAQLVRARVQQAGGFFLFGNSRFLCVSYKAIKNEMMRVKHQAKFMFSLKNDMYLLVHFSFKTFRYIFWKHAC